jgi:hypothetical protein
MYDFNLNRNKPLAEEAERAADTIYSAGIMFVNGKIGPGGNNVMADSAATAFTEQDIDTLFDSGNDREALCAGIILMRRVFAEASKKQDAGSREYWERAVQGEILEGIYETAQALKAAGWRPKSEPHRISGPRPV